VLNWHCRFDVLSPNPHEAALGNLVATPPPHFHLQPHTTFMNFMSTTPVRQFVLGKYLLFGRTGNKQLNCRTAAVLLDIPVVVRGMSSPSSRPLRTTAPTEVSFAALGFYRVFGSFLGLLEGAADWAQGPVFRLQFADLGPLPLSSPQSANNIPSLVAVPGPIMDPSNAWTLDGPNADCSILSSQVCACTYTMGSFHRVCRLRHVAPGCSTLQTLFCLAATWQLEVAKYILFAAFGLCPGLTRPIQHRTRLSRARAVTACQRKHTVMQSAVKGLPKTDRLGPKIARAKSRCLGFSAARLRLPHVVAVLPRIITTMSAPRLRLHGSCSGTSATHWHQLTEGLPRCNSDDTWTVLSGQEPGSTPLKTRNRQPCTCRLSSSSPSPGPRGTETRSHYHSATGDASCRDISMSPVWRTPPLGGCITRPPGFTFFCLQLQHVIKNMIT
jgi:hypothetical protein